MSAPPAERSSQRNLFRTYREATWGLKNHWYPALFSHELAEGEAKGIRISGVPIVLRRARGKVYALKDECAHRGVRLSARPLCLTDTTISCWYHGYTYDLETGVLSDIIASPDDQLIGKARIRTYPVHEVKGLIYLFFGDEGYAPLPPLADDLPPPVPEDCPYPTAHLLAPDTMVLGIRRECVGNWRLAAESGGDPGHILIHRDSPWLMVKNYMIGLGESAASNRNIATFEGKGPKGIIKRSANASNGNLEEHYVFENKKLNIRARGSEPAFGLQISLYLPCVLLVENWPETGLASYEWYVPTDEGHHMYWQIVAKTCPTERDREEFHNRFTHVYHDLALHGFNDDDVFARVEMEPFYESGRGWKEEQLCNLDTFIVEWRKLVACHHRGIQPPPRRDRS